MEVGCEDILGMLKREVGVERINMEERTELHGEMRSCNGNAKGKEKARDVVHAAGENLNGDEDVELQLLQENTATKTPEGREQADKNIGDPIAMAHDNSEAAADPQQTPKPGTIQHFFQNTPPPKMPKLNLVDKDKQHRTTGLSVSPPPRNPIPPPSRTSLPAGNENINSPTEKRAKKRRKVSPVKVELWDEEASYVASQDPGPIEERASKKRKAAIKATENISKTSISNPEVARVLQDIWFPNPNRPDGIYVGLEEEGQKSEGRRRSPTPSRDPMRKGASAPPTTSRKGKQSVRSRVSQSEGIVNGDGSPKTPIPRKLATTPSKPTVNNPSRTPRAAREASAEAASDTWDPFIAGLEKLQAHAQAEKTRMRALHLELLEERRMRQDKERQLNLIEEDVNKLEEELEYWRDKAGEEEEARCRAEDEAIRRKDWMAEVRTMFQQVSCKYQLWLLSD